MESLERDPAQLVRKSWIAKQKGVSSEAVRLWLISRGNPVVVTHCGLELVPLRVALRYINDLDRKPAGRRKL